MRAVRRAAAHQASWSSIVLAAAAGPVASTACPSIEGGVGQVEADRVAHRGGVELGEDLPQLLDGSEAAGHAAVGHERHWLGSPLVVGEVDGLLERGGVAVVVLGCDDHEPVCPVDALDVGVDRRVAVPG